MLFVKNTVNKIYILKMEVYIENYTWVYLEY